jgi:hypothetical protein
MLNSRRARLFATTCLLSALLCLSFLSLWLFSFFRGLHAYYSPDYGASAHRWQYVLTCCHEGIRLSVNHVERLIPAYPADAGTSLRLMPRFKGSTMYESERQASRVRLPGVLWYGQTFGLNTQPEYGGSSSRARATT